ncbi:MULTISPECIES: hypothetical protein [Thermoanaerobacter]|uniref:hypothetical protein n=1 Tax=Thermoanaerobacter TaxID=1754 RepID=UPI0004112909|nr:hypothetical protein [Thermoanaerobacter sp. A7A]
MKRIVTVLLTLILIFSTTVVFGATDNVLENEPAAIFEGSIEMSVVENTKLSSMDFIYLPNYHADIGGGILLSDIIYRHNNNELARYVAKLSVDFIVASLAYQYKLGFPTSFVIDRFTNTLISWFNNNYLQDTYTGAWMWKAWSNYENVYVIYVTLVHYSDGTYTKPIKVQTLEIGREYGTTVEYYY